METVTRLSGQRASACWWEREHLTLDGDLGMGGGPPGLRVWLVASLPLSVKERLKKKRKAKVKETTRYK